MGRSSRLPSAASRRRGADGPLPISTACPPGLRFSPSTAPGAGPTWPCSKLVHAIPERRPHRPLGNRARLSRDFTHVDDIVEGIDASQTSPCGRCPLAGAPDASLALSPLQHRQRQPGQAAGLRECHRVGPRQTGHPQHAAHAARRRFRHPGPTPARCSTPRAIAPVSGSRKGSTALSLVSGTTTGSEPNEGGRVPTTATLRSG